MIDPPSPPANDTDDVEPEAESGAGYGNHAPEGPRPEDRSSDET